MSKGAKPRDKATTGKLARRRPRARRVEHCELCGVALGYRPKIHIAEVALGETFAYYVCRRSDMASACARRTQSVTAMPQNTPAAT